MPAQNKAIDVDPAWAPGVLEMGHGSIECRTIKVSESEILIDRIESYPLGVSIGDEDYMVTGSEVNAVAGITKLLCRKI